MVVARSILLKVALLLLQVSINLPNQDWLISSIWLLWQPDLDHWETLAQLKGPILKLRLEPLMTKGTSLRKD